MEPNKINTNVAVSPNINLNPAIEEMFKVGAHFAYAKARRHPTAKPFLFGVKNRVEIFDLEKTEQKLEAAKKFVSSIAATGKHILFIGGKSEAKAIVEKAAKDAGMPYVAGRWIGGTFTNFAVIRRRVDEMLKMTDDREKGNWAKYTKKERLLNDRKLENLEIYFGGLRAMKELPKAVFIIDQKREHIAAEEAQKVGIPIISLSSSDCDFSKIQYAIPANDGSAASISYFVGQIAEAIKRAKI